MINAQLCKYIIGIVDQGLKILIATVTTYDVVHVLGSTHDIIITGICMGQYGDIWQAMNAMPL